mmetsp:Transcript_49007/g.115104  ORF Transcript_49007/g.115104 Transcript_49007/m.115104 type:complete len:293 (+) Transcript_49007:3719-4597(+)
MVAANTGLGRWASGPASSSMASAMKPATNTRLQRLAEPASCSRMLREKLPATGMPPVTDATRLAAARPRSSAAGSSFSPRRWARDSDTARLDTKPISPTSAAAGSRRSQSAASSGGRPTGTASEGSAPTWATPCAAGVRADSAIATTSSSSGANRASVLEPRRRDSSSNPTAAAPQAALSGRMPPCSAERSRSGSVKPAAVLPSSTGNWPAAIISVAPFSKPRNAGTDSRLASASRRSNAASARKAPTSAASTSAPCSADTPAGRPAKAWAIISASTATGPRPSTGLEPSAA